VLQSVAAYCSDCYHLLFTTSVSCGVLKSVVVKRVAVIDMNCSSPLLLSAVHCTLLQCAAVCCTDGYDLLFTIIVSFRVFFLQSLL